MRLRVIALTLFVGCCSCRFDSTGVSYEDAGDVASADAGAIDAFLPVVLPADVRFVEDQARLGGVASLTMAGGTIDTSLMQTVGTALPDGAWFDAWVHEDHAELAVLHVRDLHIPPGATVRVVGHRPLVVLASFAVRIDGVLDVGARGHRPGPGGARPGSGDGAGQPGEHHSSGLDGGGGGASYGGHGGHGGRAKCQPDDDDDQEQRGGRGDRGEQYGDATVPRLVGGSGGARGGAGRDCVVSRGGAGGGALYVFALGHIYVGSQGVVRASGSGGTAGVICRQSGGGGGGGGSGGTVVLHSGAVTVDGRVAVNGGGGGAGAVGEPGDDGDGGAVGAPGGQAVSEQSSDGGRGASSADDARSGDDVDGCGDANAGGGGGGLGRVLVELR